MKTLWGFNQNGLYWAQIRHADGDVTGCSGYPTVASIALWMKDHGADMEDSLLVRDV